MSERETAACRFCGEEYEIADRTNASWGSRPLAHHVMSDHLSELDEWLESRIDEETLAAARRTA